MFARFSRIVRSPASGERALRVVLLFLFVWLAGRFWHPYYGFTQLLQIDPEMASRMVPALRGGPVFIHSLPGSYDGGYYVQIATNPALDAATLQPAIDDAGYRARRILLAAVAWLLGGGEPMRVAQVYAAQNILLWFALAGVLWRVFPVGSARGTLAWTALLFSAGILISVRLALTDLAALMLTAWAVWQFERGRAGPAAGLIGLAALVRETAVLALFALWPGWREAGHRWGRTLLLLTLAGLPLTLWLLYVWHVFGGLSAGQGAFAWPLAGWLARWPELAGGVKATGNPLLVACSFLEHVALTVQAIYLVRHARMECPWWRLSAASLVLFVMLGHSMWDSFPNAASRALLPLTLAFNVLAVRHRAALAWLLLGNLSVAAGLHALWAPPPPPHELPAHSTLSSRHLLETDQRWSVAEWNDKWRWAWCAGEGRLTYRVWPRRAAVKMELQVRGVTPRTLVVSHHGREIWRGAIGDRPQWITLPELPGGDGRLELELRSETPPTGEGADNTARNISFACFGARLAE